MSEPGGNYHLSPSHNQFTTSPSALLLAVSVTQAVWAGNPSLFSLFISLFPLHFFLIKPDSEEIVQWENETRGKESERQKHHGERCCMSAYGCFYSAYIEWPSRKCLSKDLRCSVACYKSTSRPGLRGHCGKTIPQSKRESWERERTKWKTTARPSKDRDKRAFPLLPAPRTWLINHLYTINHQASSARLTRSIQMPLYLRKRREYRCRDAELCRVCRGAHRQKGKTHENTYSAYTHTAHSGTKST